MNKLKNIYIAAMFILIAIFLLKLVIEPAGIQYDLFFARTNDYMADYYNNLIYVRDNNPYNSLVFGAQEHCYPPLAYLIFIFCSKITLGSIHPNMVVLVCHYFMFLISLLLFKILFDSQKSKSLKNQLIVISFLFSGIFLSSFERGNIVILVTAFIAYFIFNHNSDDKVRRELALLSVAAAGALKITPVILTILLLYNKQYKEFFRVILYLIILFFAPFLFLHGGFENVSTLLHNMVANTQFYSSRGLPSFMIAKLFLPYSTVAFYFTRFSTCLCGIALVTNFALKEKWKKIAQLLLILFSISSSSALYVMLYFFPFIIIFFDKDDYKKNDWIYLLLFIVILSPLQIADGFNHIITSDLIKYAELILLICLTKESVSNAFSALKK